MNRKQHSYMHYVVAMACFLASLAVTASAPTLPNPNLLTNAGGVYTEPLGKLDLLLKNYTRPPDNPVAPGDIFTSPGTTITPPYSAPGIGEFTRQAPASSSIAMIGGGFTDAKVWMYSQTTTTNGQLVEADLIRTLPPSNLTALIPKGIPYGMIMLWVQNDNGVSYPVRVNAPDAYWLGPEWGLPGGSISVYGRNLSRNNGTSQSYVRIRSWGAGSGIASTVCAVTAVNPYKVTFTIPSGIATNTDYEVWIHNGHGGDYGWSGPLKMTVKSASQYQWSGTVRDVTSFGAIPNDGQDDKTAIQSALNSSAPGDIVRFPAGEFLISDSLTVPSGVSVEGAGMNLTILKTTALFNNSAMISFGHGSSCRLKDMSLTQVSGAWTYSMIGLNGTPTLPSSGFFVQNVSASIPAGSASMVLYLAYATDVTVNGCIFTCPNVTFCNKVRQIRFTGNVYNGNAVWNSGSASGNGFNFWGTRELDISGNLMQSVDHDNGLFSRRAIVAQCHSGNDMDFYIAKNQMYNIAPYQCIGNSGENILMETGTNYYQGTSISASNSVLTFSGVNWTANQFVTDNLPSWSASLLLVLNGPGAGQWRKIVGNTANTITIDRPFEFDLGNNVIVGISAVCARSVFYDNICDTSALDCDHNGIPDTHEKSSATTGIEIFGIAYDCTIANNQLAGLRFGIFLDALGCKIGQPNLYHKICYNILCINNVINDCYNGIFVTSNLEGGTDDYTLGPLMVNTVVRGNELNNIPAIGIGADLYNEYWFWDWPWCTGTIFESNSITNAHTGMYFGKQEANTTVRLNSFQWTSLTSGTTAIKFSDYADEPYLPDNLIDNDADTWLTNASDVNGLIAHWKFDRSSWTGKSREAHDEGLNHFDGISMGSVSAEPGISGNAAIFDNSVAQTQDIVLSYPIELTTFTISAWFKLNDHCSSYNPNQMGTDSHYIFCSKNMVNTGYKGIGFFYAGYIVKLIDRDGTSATLAWDVRSFVGDNTWHHVAITYDGITGNIYGDGVLKNSRSFTLNKICPLDNDGYSIPYFIGSRNSLDSRMNGGVDELRIYDRALNQSEITDLYNNP